MGHRLIARRRKLSIIMLVVSDISILFEPSISDQIRIPLVCIQITHVQNYQMIPVKKCRVLDSKSPEVFLHLLCEDFTIFPPGECRHPGSWLVHTSVSCPWQSSLLLFQSLLGKANLALSSPTLQTARGFHCMAGTSIGSRSS